jgi:hypothetical protein
MATVLATVEPTLQVATLGSVNLDREGVDASYHFVIEHMWQAIAWVQAGVPDFAQLAEQNTQVANYR